MFFRKKKSIDDYVDEVNEDIVLIDVRSKDEYREGHFKGSQNIPLERIKNINIDKRKTLYVYCYSGSRSASAVRQLKSMGYNATNIGGIYKTKKKLIGGRL